MARKQITERTALQTKAPAGRNDRIEIWDTVLPGFCLRITGNDVRTYTVTYRYGSGAARKRYRLTIGDAKIMRLVDAREAAREKLIAVSRGVNPAKVRVRTKTDAAPGSFSNSRTSSWPAMWRSTTARAPTKRRSASSSRT
jgi:hypothetical protein